MHSWPVNPTIYEIDTWPWLDGLGRRLGRRVTLDSVPEAEWDTLAAWGFDAVWLMGVWERSQVSVDLARAHPDLVTEFRRALPDFSPADVVGSPYSVRRYVAEPHLGGPAGLGAARQALARRKMRLVLDFVPNHTARNCPWVAEHPEYFVSGTPADLERAPDQFFASHGRVLACGRDPNSPAWTDVAQVDAFSPALRQATVATLDDIAGQCDAVRCDMAMLLMNDVFARTWGQRVGRPPAADFWPHIISAVRARHPCFGFVAEAYWNTEAQLAEQGFDYCYDKGLYDRLVHGHAPVVRAHLEEDPARQARAVHFVENHDEARAATAFAFGKERAAALAALTVPGARLFHRGQLEGCRIKVPVQLGRWPDEPEDAQLTDFYRRLLGALREPALAGAWALCDVSGWHGHQQHPSILAWCWRKDAEQCLVVVNLAGHPAQARVRLPWHDLGKRAWRLRDSFADATYDRAGDELAGTGLYVDLRGWGFHFLRFEPIAR